MIARAAAAALVGLAAASCADLPPVGECGNRLIELGLGEACDDGGESVLCTAACEVRCVDAIEQPGNYVEVDPGVFCPPGNVCGDDALCRRPSGLFASASDGIQFPFDATQLELVDTNADGIDDLLGISATTVRIRYGDPDQPLDNEFGQSAPPIGGQAALVDVTSDGETERALLVPTLSGVVQYRFHDGTPVTELELAFLIPNGSELPDPMYRSIQRLRGVVGGAPASGNAKLAIVVPEDGFVRVYDPTTPPPHTPMATCSTGYATATTNGTMVAVTPDDWDSFAVGVTALPNPPGQPVPRSTICHFQPGSPWVVTPISIPLGEVLHPLANIVFAHVDTNDGDACRDLVFTTFSATGSKVYYVDVDDIATAGSCRPTGLPEEITTPLAIGSAGIVLAAGRPGDVGRDGLVTSEGVFKIITRGPTLYELDETDYFRAARGWASAAVADLDGDARDDVVAVSFARDDVDVVRFSPLTGAPSPYRADTLRPAQFVVTGDLDGDFIDDVAVVEESDQGQGISVLFGAAGGIVGPPVAMGDFDGQIGVVDLPTRIKPGAVLDEDAAHDLAVVIVPILAPTDAYPTDLPAGFLYGGPTRRLVSPEWASPPPALPPPEVRGVVAIPGGASERVALFANGGSVVEPGLGCASPPGGPNGASWWYWHWNPDPAIEKYDNDTDQRVCDSIGGAARLAAGTLADTVVVMIADNGGDQIGGALHVLGEEHACQPALVKFRDTVLFGNQRPGSITVHDLTADAGDEVLLGFEPAVMPAQLVIAGTRPGQVPPGPNDDCPLPDRLLLDVGGAISAPGVHGLDGHDCVAGAVLPVVIEDDTGAVTWSERLVAACTSTSRDPMNPEPNGAALVMVDPRVATSTTALPPGSVGELARAVGEAQRLVIGDVNGDGLDDIVLQVEVGAQLQVEVFTQCPAHDTLRCTAGGSINTSL